MPASRLWSHCLGCCSFREAALRSTQTSDQSLLGSARPDDKNPLADGLSGRRREPAMRLAQFSMLPQSLTIPEDAISGDCAPGFGLLIASETETPPNVEAYGSIIHVQPQLSLSKGF